MKQNIFIAIFLFVNSLLTAQVPDGVYRGIIQKNGQDLKDSDVLYIAINNADFSNSHTRMEILSTKLYAVKRAEIITHKDALHIEEKLVKSNSRDRNAPLCKMKYALEYNHESGYLSGSFISLDCKRNAGNVVLYRTEEAFNFDEDPASTHYFQHQLVRAISRGFPAPEVLEKKRMAFQFQPILFDHDEAVIRPEYHAYLKEMAVLLDAIHDLRVKVTGHTDAVGTDAYNIGLSERRAAAIIAFFAKQGIDSDKLEMDFKGERQPIDDNTTPEGKQRNRRVDFEFI